MNPELHYEPWNEPAAGRIRRARVVHERNVASLAATEINDCIDALAGHEEQGAALGRRGQESAISSDLHQRLSRYKRQLIDAGVGGVEEPEAIAAGLDVEEGGDAAVDQNGGSEKFGNPGGIAHGANRISKLTARVENSVLYHERNVVGTGG